jgi:hypothetical protein
VGGACSANGGEYDCVYVIGRKARGKETTRKTKRTGVDNIKMDLVHIEWGYVD